MADEPTTLTDEEQHATVSTNGASPEAPQAQIRCPA